MHAWRAVLADHSDEHTLGVILNKPSNYTLAELQLTHELPEFGSCQLYCGGDVGGGEVGCQHGSSTVAPHPTSLCHQLGACSTLHAMATRTIVCTSM